MSKLEVNGVTFANISGAELVRGATVANERQTRKVPEIQPEDLRGHYDCNNGMLTAVDLDGKTHVSCDVDGLTEGLNAQGFTRSSSVMLYCLEGEHPRSATHAFGSFTRNLSATTGKGFVQTFGTGL